MYKKNTFTTIFTVFGSFGICLSYTFFKKILQAQVFHSDLFEIFTQYFKVFGNNW